MNNKQNTPDVLHDIVKAMLEYSSNLRSQQIMKYKLAENLIDTKSETIYYVCNNQAEGKEVYYTVVNAFCKENNLRPVFMCDSAIIYDSNTVYGMITYDNYTDKTFYLYYLLNAAYTDSFINVMNSRNNKNNTPILTRLSLDSRGILDSNNILFNAPKINMPDEIMYPWFENSPSEIAAQFMKSTANVLVLYGDPGTGKTTYIKKLLQAIGFNDDRTISIVDTPDVMNTPELVNNIYSSKEHDIFVFEDVDRHLYSRKEGNDVMAGLLNAAEGLASPDVKIIISTNIKQLSEIDSALIRPGRCFKTLEFHKLKEHEQINVREFLGLDITQCTSERKSLAEVMNDKATEREFSFGFNAVSPSTNKANFIAVDIDDL